MLNCRPPVSSAMRPVRRSAHRRRLRIAERTARQQVRLHEAVGAAGGNKAVARRSGVPLATVNNYVRGRNGMKIGPLSALAAACNVSLDWIVSGREAAAAALTPVPDLRVPGAWPSAGSDFPLSVARPLPVADLPVPVAGPPPGLAEAQSKSSPAGMRGGVDVRVLAKAVEIVAALAGAADFVADPKGLARRIATTYAVLTEPDASHE